jgi:hypothetical protein
MPGTITDLLPWFPLKRLIELYYPFTINDLKTLESTLDFEPISRNSKISWNKKILDSFKDKLWWGGLSYNPSVVWDNETISRYEGKIRWQNALEHPNFAWSRELFLKHRDDFDFLNILQIPVELKESDLELFSPEQLRYICLIENLPWSEALLEKYKDVFDWEIVSSNPGIPFSKDLYCKYFDRWDHNSLQANKRLISDSYIFEFLAFATLDFSAISAYKEDWTMRFINWYEKELDWDQLSGNKHLPWDQGIIEKFEDRWNWFVMSGNRRVPWTWELIEKHEDEWNWCGDDEEYLSSFYSMSANSSLPWSRAFVERFGHHMGFGSVEKIGENDYNLKAGISSIHEIDWDIDFLLKYKHQWEIDSLSGNSAIYSMLEKVVGRKQILNLYRVVV